MFKRKPIGEYTLKEVKDFCLERIKAFVGKENIENECGECDFNRICSLCAEDWILNKTVKFSEKEIAAAKVFLEAGVEAVSRMEYRDADLKAYSPKKEDGSRRCWNIPKALFPTIEQGQTFRLNEITNGNAAPAEDEEDL